MELLEFYGNVNQDSALQGHGISVDGFDVMHVASGICTNVSLEAVEKMEWETLGKILRVEQEPEVLYHMSRVVGYFSRIENWNKSKLGELADRQRGDYTP